jgi:hypothetical protein
MFGCASKASRVFVTSVQKVHGQIDDTFPAVPHEKALVAGEFADVAGGKPEMTGPSENVRHAVRRHGQHHAFLRFGQPHFPWLQSGVFALHGGEIDRHAGAFAELAHRGGQTAGSAIGQRTDQRIRAVEQFDEQIGDESFDDGITDLHRGASHLAGRGIHGHGRKSRSADAVASGCPADYDNAVAGLRRREFVIAFQNFTDAAAENERVGRVARIIEHGARHRGDAHFVAVVGHSLDHAFLDDGRMQHARGKLVMVEVARTETKNIGQGHGTRGGRDDIADDAAHAGVGPAERFDGTGVVVSFRFDGETEAVSEGHDARIAVESRNNEGRGHFLRCLAQLPQERNDFALGSFDACTEAFVRAVVAPRLRDGFQFRIGRIAPGLFKPLPDQERASVPC